MNGASLLLQIDHLRAQSLPPHPYADVLNQLRGLVSREININLSVLRIPPGALDYVHDYFIPTSNWIFEFAKILVEEIGAGDYMPVESKQLTLATLADHLFSQNVFNDQRDNFFNETRRRLNEMGLDFQEFNEAFLRNGVLLNLIEAIE